MLQVFSASQSRFSKGKHDKKRKKLARSLAGFRGFPSSPLILIVVVLKSVLIALIEMYDIPHKLSAVYFHTYS